MAEYKIVPQKGAIQIRFVPMLFNPDEFVQKMFYPTIVGTRCGQKEWANRNRSGHSLSLTLSFLGNSRYQTTRNPRFPVFLYRKPRETECSIVRLSGSPIGIVGPRAPPEMVSNGQALASPKDVFFRDPSSFVPGELYNHYQEWEKNCS